MRGDCQIFDDPRSQNFTGWRKAGGTANIPWRQAVDETMTSDRVDVLRPPGRPGKIAEGLYFASSGRFAVGGTTFSGTVANADAFGSTPLSYLVHVDDPDSAAAPGNPYRNWTRKISQGKLAAFFDLGPLRSVRVTERYPGGLVKSVSCRSVRDRTPGSSIVAAAA